MRRTRFTHLLFIAVAALATSAQAHFKGPTTARPDSAVRPDKMQPAPSKPLTPQGPLAAPAMKPLTPQGPLAAPSTGAAKPLTPSPANAPAAAPRPSTGTSPNASRSTRSSIDTHFK
jgi:hypothetical protein